MAFYGGLGDLLATAAMGDWPDADEICVAVALDSWKPTRGTRLTAKRNTGRRFVFSNSKLEFPTDPAPRRAWNFPAPFGAQDVVGLGFSEIITISRHLRTPEIHAFMNLAPITDLRNPDTPEPVAADESGRSSQTFLVEVVARRGSEERRTIARGRDIYAITVRQHPTSKRKRFQPLASPPSVSANLRGNVLVTFFPIFGQIRPLSVAENRIEFADRFGQKSRTQMLVSLRRASGLCVQAAVATV